MIHIYAFQKLRAIFTAKCIIIYVWFEWCTIHFPKKIFKHKHIKE